MRAWYVVYTRPKVESRVVQHLAIQGFETYFPCYRKQRRHARRVEEVHAPLFPRYLFVHLDLYQQNWQPINSTLGVNKLVGINGEPTPLPEGTIEEIRSWEDDKGTIELPLLELQKGQKYRIINGPFENIVGIFEEMIDKRRVVLLLHILGHQVRINAPIQVLHSAT